MTTPPSLGQRLTVIIPLGPDETAADGLLAQLHALPAGSEVVLVGAGAPPPMPVGWPHALPCHRLASPAGRARQMNAGAAQAAGDWLWFLHADTRLTLPALPALAHFLAAGRPALGWFWLRFAADGPALTRLNGWGANIRSAVFGLPFGDQGLVLPTACFAAVGGYDETVAAGEDHHLVWALRRAGVGHRPVGAAIVTSARKYARLGWAKTTWRHWKGDRGASICWSEEPGQELT